MSDSGADRGAEDRTDPPTFDPEDVLFVDDDRFAAENVPIVTGAASSIGRATALACAANGLTVAATDIDGEGLDGTRRNWWHRTSEIPRTGSAPRAHEGDGRPRRSGGLQLGRRTTPTRTLAVDHLRTPTDRRPTPL